MYNYVTSGQVERTNELIIENNEILEDIKTDISFYGGVITFILVLAVIIMPIVRKALGVKNG